MRLVSMAFMIANLFALLMVASARAAEEPTGFRDIPFGASEAQIREKLPTAKCLAVAGDDQHDDVSCSVSSMIGHVPVLVFYRLVGEPMQRRMMNVTLSFKSEDFGRISQAMTDRYGPPTNVSEQRETLRWVGRPDAHVRHEVQFDFRQRSGDDCVARVHGTRREATEGAAGEGEEGPVSRLRP